MARSLRLPLKTPMFLMARVEGPAGIKRELTTVLDPNFAYSVIFSRDAIDLGYPEAAMRPRELEKSHPERVPYILEFRGIERSVLVRLAKVSIGPVVARDVEALVIELDLARPLPVDLILGRTFLKDFRLTVDGKKGYLSLA
ncbi:MAG: hypothetical protein ABSF83_10775 [Nitrososphaerales archaeon]|jgi:hypothetical protein